MRPAGGTFGAVQTLQSSCATGVPYDAISGNGAAVVDWTDTNSTCDSGVAPTLIKAAYRPTGGSFGTAVTVADMGAGAGAGDAAVSPSGTATVATLGNMTSSASTAAATALPRLSDGSWGEPQAISYDTAINDPPVLAYDPTGTYGQVGDSPTLATAGSGSAIAVWATGVLSSYCAAQASTYGPNSVGSPGPSGSPSSLASGSLTSAGSPSAGSASTPLNPVAPAGSSGRARSLVLTGGPRRARAVQVTLMLGHRVYARGSAKPAHGRYRVVLTLVRVPSGRYTVQISLIDGGRTVRQRRSVTITT